MPAMPEKLDPPRARGPVDDPRGEAASDRDLDLLDMDDTSLLTPLERAQIRFVRATLNPGLLDRTIRVAQRSVGQWWIRTVTNSLRHVHGLEHLPAWDPGQSVICVANHRSFFDLYITTAELVAQGLPHRILFPVRSNFFYDHPLGPLVNGVMSFFAMYPPIFRERARASLNLAGIDEVAWIARRGGAFIGMHPEGTRNKDGDPYAFLPAQSGVGRIIRQANVEVIPVFVNGLVNDLWKQVSSNARGDGVPIVVVFGKPIDFGGLLQENPSPRLYKRIADRSIEVIRELGGEERDLRARL
jgi:1-acyl-sn-glycerol-3-phosphate acyltransferase